MIKKLRFSKNLLSRAEVRRFLSRNYSVKKKYTKVQRARKVVFEVLLKSFSWLRLLHRFLVIIWLISNSVIVVYKAWSTLADQFLIQWIVFNSAILIQDSNSSGGGSAPTVPTHGSSSSSSRNYRGSFGISESWAAYHTWEHHDATVSWLGWSS